jgi:hypothetical protein
MKKIEIADFAELFDTTIDEIQSSCGDMVNDYDFSYDEITGSEKDKLLLEILKKIDCQSLPAAGSDRKPDWESGWDENLQEFQDHNYDTRFLIPKYFKRKTPLKLRNQLILPASDSFEYHYLSVFRKWLFLKYFSKAESIYEFGCGSADNLVLLSKLFPGKQLYGYDWTRTSGKIIDLLRTAKNLNINGGCFDFFQPDKNVDFNANSGVLTFGALEQTGARYHEFLNFLLEKAPSIVVNVECLDDFYDENSLLDYLALSYHNKRHYLSHYYKKLVELEAMGKIEIIKSSHHRFSNIFNDTHSFIIWKIKNNQQ